MNTLLFCLLLMPLMTNQSQEEGKSRIEQLQGEVGLFFEKLPDLRIYQTQWRLVTSLDVEKYVRHAPPVQQLISILNQLCKRHETAKCLNEGLGPRLIKKEENTLYYRNLIRSAIGDHPYLKTRSPRRGAPFAFMGTVSNVLFGTLTQEDADFYNQELNKIYKNQQEITEVIARQTHIIKGEFSTVNTRLLNLTKGMSDLIKAVSEHSQQLLETQTELDKLRFENILREALFELEKGLDDYSTNLLLLIDAILLAKQGILHPVIFSPQQLLNSAFKIRQTSSHEFPFSPEELLTEQLERITTLNIVFTKGRIVFELTVPLLDHQIFNLYKIYPCPSVQSLGPKKVSSYIQPRFAYIAISSDEQRYFLPSEDYLGTCHFHHKQLLGPATLPVYQTSQHATCETTLLLNPTTIDWSTCDIKVTGNLEPYWKALNAPAAWLFFMPEEKKAQIYCKDKKATVETFFKTGILKLEAGCQTTINSVQLKALDIIESSQEIVYSPAVSYNLSFLLPELSEHHFKILDAPSKEQITKHWDDLPPATSLDEIEKQVKGIMSHQKLVKHQQVAIFSSSGIAVVLIISLAILILKLRVFKKPDPVRNNAEQTESNTVIESPATDTEPRNLRPSASIY